MTHPTDDEIMSLAVRYLGEHAAHASTGLHRFARALLAEQARTQTHKAEDAPSDSELLDSRGKIRSDLKSSAYCVGNEYKPFHPSASHVRPEWRDGWNACFVAAIRAARAKE